MLYGFAEDHLGDLLRRLADDKVSALGRGEGQGALSDIVWDASCGVHQASGARWAILSLDGSLECSQRLRTGVHGCMDQHGTIKLLRGSSRDDVGS